MPHIKPPTLQEKPQNKVTTMKIKNTETKGYSKEILNFVADNSQKP